MFPLFSVNTGVDNTKDQGWKVCKLLSACQPGRIARWRHLQLHMLHHGWNIFLLGVCIFGILLLMGHHRQDYQKHCCLLLHSPPPWSCSQASPAAPSLELHEQMTSPGRPSPPAAVLQQGSSSWGMFQQLFCASPVPKSWMHQVLQFAGPSAWQLSWALNLLFKVTSVLHPEGMEEQMQPVKSGFNSPASFNFLPCLLINESALAALGMQRFFHIRENSTQRLCWLSSQGLEQAVSCLLWGCFIMDFPPPEALAHSLQSAAAAPHFLAGVSWHRAAVPR